MSTTSELFLRNIRAILARKGLQAKALAQATGMPTSQLSNYMTGKHQPSLDKIELIARALGVRAFELLMNEMEQTLWAGVVEADSREAVRRIATEFPHADPERVRALLSERQQTVRDLTGSQDARLREVGEILSRAGTAKPQKKSKKSS